MILELTPNTHPILHEKICPCDKCIAKTDRHDVAKILIEMLKETDDYDQWIRYVEDRPYNDQRYYISNSKLKKLGWTIKINFIDGLKDLISSKK